MEREKLISIVIISALAGATIICNVLDIIMRIKKLRDMVDENSSPVSYILGSDEPDETVAE